MVFVDRIDNEIENLKALKHRGKFGGATGAMNAHFVAYPEVDWRAFATKFLAEGLGLVREQHTTQLQVSATLVFRTCNKDIKGSLVAIPVNMRVLTQTIRSAKMMLLHVALCNRLYSTTILWLPSFTRWLGLTPS